MTELAHDDRQEYQTKLWEKVKAGDKEALGDLLLSMERYMRKTVSKILHRRAIRLERSLMNDVVQEVCLTIADEFNEGRFKSADESTDHSFHQFKGFCSKTAMWTVGKLYNTERAVCRDVRTTRSIDSRDADGKRQEQYHDPKVSGPLDEVIALELQNKIESIVGRVKNKNHRELLRLHVQGTGTDKIMEKLGFTERSVITLRSKLVKKLEEEAFPREHNGIEL